MTQALAASPPSVQTAAGASHDEKAHRADIEGLRALAVGLVVAYHAGVPYLGGGYVGVDVFFVISGFLITSLLVGEIGRRGTLSFGGFYARRARRLLPVATVVLAATAVAFSIVLLPIDRGGLSHDISAAALYVANWHFASTALTYGTNASLNPVLHYWSLSVEEQFYVVWPIVLFAVTRRWRRTSQPVHLVRRVTLALSVIAVASLALSIVLTPRSTPYAYYGLHTRAWELAAGGLLALGARHLGGRSAVFARAAAGWAGVALVVFAAVRFGASTSFPGFAAALPVGGALLILAAGCGAPATPRLGVSRVLSLPPVTYGGRISYAMYLWHWPCLILLGTMASSGGSRLSVAHGWLAALAVLIALGLTVVSHHLVENPARFSAWMRPSMRSLGAGAVAMAVTVMVAAALLPRSDGAIRTPVLAYVAPLPLAASATGAALSTAPGTAVPVRLTMTPGQARRDITRGTGPCFDRFQDTAAPSACVFGDPHGTVSVALIGDSHAEAIFPALDRVAVAHHWKLWLWAKPACPMIDMAVRLPQFEGSYPWCTSWRHNVLARLAAIPHLDTVFATHFAGVAQIPGRFALGDGPALSFAQLPAAWTDAWSTTDQQLSALSRHVVVIRDVPQPSADIPDCLDRFAPNEIPCSIPRSAALRNVELLARAEAAGSTPTTRFIDLDLVLCPSDPCPVITADGKIIYRDSEHLTATVSAELAPALEAAIRKASPALGI